jgi:hypothetical protein
VPTASQARKAVRSRIESGNITYTVSGNTLAVPLRWQNENADSQSNAPLPDVPAPFIFTEVLTERSRIVAFGGGVGANLHRNPLVVNAFVFVPRGWGLDTAEAIAEQVGNLLRSYRDGVVSFFEATVYQGGDGADIKPAGLESEVGNYFWAGCEAFGHYDRIG